MGNAQVLQHWAGVWTLTKSQTPNLWTTLCNHHNGPHPTPFIPAGKEHSLALAAPGMGLRSITAPMVSSGTLWDNSVHSSACDRANGCLSLLKKSEHVPGWLRLACAALQGCFPLSPGETSTERALQAHFPCSNTRVSNRDSHRN